MQSSCTKKFIIILGIGCGMLTAFIIYYSYFSGFLPGRICQFDPAWDTQPILDIFKNNWHSLVEGKDYSPEFMMKNRTPGTDPKYFGALKIKVMREGRRLAGFITYYMKRSGEGEVVLLAVGESFRGKRYGYALMQYAMKDLFLMGARSVALWVLVDNAPARKIYKELGFVEKFFDAKRENVYLEYHFTG